MSYYIIIRGPAGVGKSEISKILTKNLKASKISIDSVMHKHKLDAIKEGHISKQNFIQGNKIVIPKAVKLLKNNRIVIFDGCFYDRSQINYLIKNLKFPYTIFTMNATVDECVNRDKKRSTGGIGKKEVKTVYKLVSKNKIGTEIDTSNKTVKVVAK